MPGAIRPQPEQAELLLPARAHLRGEWVPRGGWVVVPQAKVREIMLPPPLFRTLAVRGMRSNPVRVWTSWSAARQAVQGQEGSALLVISTDRLAILPWQRFEQLYAQRHESDPRDRVTEAARLALRAGWRGYQENDDSYVVINPAEVRALEAIDQGDQAIGRKVRHESLRLFVTSKSATDKYLTDSNYSKYLGMLTTPNVQSDMRRIVAHGLPWAIDNGGYKKNPRTGQFEPVYKLAGSEQADSKLLRYVERLYETIGEEGFRHLRFVSLPDVPGDAKTTNLLWQKWFSHPSFWYGPKAYVAQDGCDKWLANDWDNGDLEAIPWNELDAVFIGGSTEWKLGSGAKRVIAAAKSRGKYVHIGRVNSIPRLTRAWFMGADSVDGSAISMYPDAHIPQLLDHVERIERITGNDLGQVERRA